MIIDQSVRDRLTEIVSAGLVVGLGEPRPGALCIEAAICLAMGEPHSDLASCVAHEDREFAIRLNDARWSSSEARARGLLPLGLASLGTAGTDRTAWVRAVVDGTIRRLLPLLLRRATKTSPANREALEAAAVRCEQEGAREAALAARDAAFNAAVYVANANAVNDAAYAANAAVYVAAYAAANAAYAADDYADDEILTLSVQIALDAYLATNDHQEQ